MIKDPSKSPLTKVGALGVLGPPCVVALLGVRGRGLGWVRGVRCPGGRRRSVRGGGGGRRGALALGGGDLKQALTSSPVPAHGHGPAHHGTADWRGE